MSPKVILGICYMLFELQFAYAMEISSCPLCQRHHDIEKKIKINESDDENTVSINRDILELTVHYFPCLKEKINGIREWQNLPERNSQEASLARVSQQYPLNEEYILYLCFLSVIRSNNAKSPFSAEQLLFMQEKNMLESHTAKWLGWRAVLVFAALSLAGGAANFFTFVTIYDYQYNAAYGNSTRTQDVSASLGVQNFLICFGTASINLLMSYLGLLWTGSNQNALREMNDNFDKVIKDMSEDYMNLAQTLLALYFYYPDLAKDIAKEIDTRVIKQLINDGVHNNFAEKININKFVGAIDYVIDEGKRWPKDPFLANFVWGFEKTKLD